MLEGAAIIAALLLARRRGRLVRRPQWGGRAREPIPSRYLAPHRRNVMDCRTCGAEVNVRIAHCPGCGADPRLPREEAETDLRARGIALPAMTRPPMTPPAAAAPEGQTS